MSGFIEVLVSALAFLAAIFSFPANTISYFALNAQEPARAEILFGGDMMFDRTIRLVMQEKGEDFIFSCIDDVLQNADLVVANLEGPITDNPSKSVGSSVGGEGNFTFTFPTTTAELLFAHNIRLVNLGNNHIMNFGREGLVQTKKYLDAAQVAYFGDPLDSNVTAKDMNGVLLTFINYNEFGGSATTTIQQIEEARAQGRLPIVYTHWGEEYVEPPERVRELAHQFVDAGAAIVVGSHPHTVQEHEVYKGKEIYYSLGNFIFDQYFGDDVRHGLLLRVAFTSAGVQSIEEIPVELGRDRRTCPVE